MAQVTAPKIQEPGTLAELFSAAKSDLIKTEQGAVLRWVFWHAKAVGRLEVARAVLKRYEQEDFDTRCRAAAFMPDSSQYQGYMDRRPVDNLKRAETYVIEQVSFVEACVSVVDLLKGR